MDMCFGDAITFFQSFLLFLNNSPPPSSGSKLYAVCTIDHNMELEDETLDETTVFGTTPEVIDCTTNEWVWWKSHVHNPVQHFMRRFVSADVVNISYHWENLE